MGTPKNYTAEDVKNFFRKTSEEAAAIRAARAAREEEYRKANAPKTREQLQAIVDEQTANVDSIYNANKGKWESERKRDTPVFGGGMAHSSQFYIAATSNEQKQLGAAQLELKNARKALDTYTESDQKRDIAAGKEKSWHRELRDGFKNTNINEIADIATFDMHSAGNKAKINRAMEKRSRGEEISEIEQAMIDALGATRQSERYVANNGGGTAWNSIGSGLRQSVGFMARTVLTGGSLGITRELIKQGAGKAALTMLGREALRSPVYSMASDFQDKTADQYTINADGSVKMDNATSTVERLWKSYATSLTEGVSEQVGGFIPIGFVGKGLRKVAPKLLGSKIGGAVEKGVDYAAHKTKGLRETLKKTTNYNGTIDEYFEEQFNNVVEPLLTGEPERIADNFSAKQQWITLGSVAIMGSAIHSASIPGIAKDEIRSGNLRSKRNKAIGSIENEAMRQGVYDAINKGVTVEDRAKMISSLDWANATKQDVANAVDAYSWSTRLDLFKGFDQAEQTQELAARKIAVYNDTYTQGKNEQTGMLHEVSDTDNIPYFLLSGTLDETTPDGTVFVRNKATGQTEQKVATLLSPISDPITYEGGLAKLSEQTAQQISNEESEREMADADQDAIDSNVAPLSYNLGDQVQLSDGRTARFITYAEDGTMTARVAFIDPETGDQETTDIPRSQIMGLATQEEDGDVQIEDASSPSTDQIAEVQGTGEQVQASEVASPREVPLRKDGQPDYDMMPADMFLEEYSKVVPREEALADLRDFHVDLQKSIKSIQSSKVTSLNKKADNRAKLTQLQAKVSEITAVLEANSVQAEQSPLPVQASQVESQNNETPSKTQKATLREAMLALGDYVSIEDYILRDIASGLKFRWSDDGVSRGLASELGFVGNIGEQRRRIGLIRADGTTPQVYTESLVGLVGTDMPAFPGVEYDEILNTVNDTLLSISSPAQAARRAVELHTDNFDDHMSNYLEGEREIYRMEAEEYDAALDLLIAELTDEDFEAINDLFEKESLSLIPKTDNNGHNKNVTRGTAIVQDEINQAGQHQSQGDGDHSGRGPKTNDSRSQGEERQNEQLTDPIFEATTPEEKHQTIDSAGKSGRMGGGERGYERDRSETMPAVDSPRKGDVPYASIESEPSLEGQDTTTQGIAREGSVLVEPPAETTTEIAHVRFGQNNTIVTADRIEELLKIAKQKLMQLNSGFDPELFAVFTELSAGYIEAGVRKFSDFTTRMVEALGEKVRPYLASMYEGARRFPGMENISRDMDSTIYVDNYISDNKTPQDNEDRTTPIRDSGTSDPDGAVVPNVAGRKRVGATSSPLSIGESERVPEREIGSSVRSEGGDDLPNGDGSDGSRDSGASNSVPVKRRGELRLGQPTDGGSAIGDEKPHQLLRPRERNRRNFRIDDTSADLAPKGEIAKIKANIEAITLLKKLQGFSMDATTEEKATLAQYSGWGGLAFVLDRNKELNAAWEVKYKKYHDELRELLTPEEFTAAVNSTINAHYTTPQIISSIWQAVEGLGFKGGAVMEPAVGTGNFFGAIPQEISDNSKLIGYELDPITGGIAQLLYPDANIKIAGYETSSERNGSLDLVISNVPFGKTAPYDARNKDISSFSLHNYFIAKGIRQLKDGGLGVFVTSSSTMDGRSSLALRKWTETTGNADFLGAIRLPNTAFKANAGTDVTTDIIFYRKRNGLAVDFNKRKYEDLTTIREVAHEKQWNSKTRKHEDIIVPMKINEYFAQNPHMMLGEMKFAFETGRGGLYSDTDQTLQANKEADLHSNLTQAIKQLPQDIYGAERTASELERESQKTDVRLRASGSDTEMASIKAESIERGDFLKAPNGEPTNLTERQWLQVRTSAFKEWFGDWGKAARIEKLRKATNVEITGNEIIPSKDMKEYRRNALAYGKTIKGEYANKDTGLKIIVSNTGLDKLLSHDKQSIQHIQSIASIPALIENSVFISEIQPEKESPKFDSYKYFVSGLKIQGEAYTVKIVVGEKNGDRYYDHALTEIEKGELLSKIDALSIAFNANNSPNTGTSREVSSASGIKDKRLISILQNSASKVVDANGEPMVVYHGTDAVFALSQNELTDKNTLVAEQDSPDIRYDEIRSLDTTIKEIETQHAYEQNKGKHYVNRDKRTQEAKEQLQKLAQKFNTPVTVVNSKLELPENLRYASRDRQFSGLYHKQTGAVYFVVDEIRDADEATSTFLHEVVSHKGIDGLLGKVNAEKFYQAVFDSLPQRTQDAMLALTGGDQIVGGDEFVARMAEGNVTPSVMHRVVAAVRRFFREVLGMPLAVSDNDIRYILWKSKNNLERAGSVSEVFSTLSADKAIRKQIYLPDEPLLDKIEDIAVRYRSKDNPKSAEHRVSGFKNTLKSNAVQVQEVLQDSTIKVHLLQKDIEKGGGAITPGVNVYESMNHLDSRAKSTMDRYDRQFITPFVENLVKLDKKGIQYAEVSDYMSAKHSVERHLSGLNAISEEQDGKWTMEVTTTIVEDFEKRLSKQELDGFWNMWRKATDEILKTAELSGRMSAAQAAKIRSRGWQYYVPLRGKDWNFEEVVNMQESFYYDYSGYAKGKSTDKKVVNIRAKGRTTKADDPIAALQNMAHTEIYLSELNNVNLKLLRLARKYPERTDLFAVKDQWFARVGQDEWHLMEDKPSKEMIESSNEARKAKYRAETALEKATTAAERAKFEREIETAEGAIMVKQDVPQDGYTGAVPKAHEVVVMKDGKKYVVELKDPEVAAAINQRSGSVQRWLSKWPGRVTRVMSQLATSKNPLFVIPNFIRDIQHAMMYNLVDSDGDAAAFFAYAMTSWKVLDRSIRGVANPLTQSEQGSLNILDKTDRKRLVSQYSQEQVQDTLYELFYINGGETGYVHILDPVDYQRKLRKASKRSASKLSVENALPKGFKALNDGVDYLANISENITRFAAFMSQIDKGSTVFDAVSYAKNITVNFNRKGKYSKGLGSLFMFFNAGIQGAVNTYSLWGNKKGKSAKVMAAQRAKLVGAFAVLAATGFVMTMLLHDMLSAMIGDDDEEFTVSDYERRTNLIIPTGNGTYMKIPIPILFRPFYSLGVQAYDWMIGRTDGQDVAGSFLGNIADAMLPIQVDISINPERDGWQGYKAFIPSPVKPLWEIGYNQNFAGRPINKESKYAPAGTPDSQMGMPYSASWAKWISETLNKIGGGNQFTQAGVDEHGKADIRNWLDISPSSLEHIATSYTGGVGKMINDISKMLTGQDGGKTKIPIADRFYGKAYEKDPSREYYDLKSAIERVRRNNKLAREQGSDSAWFSPEELNGKTIEGEIHYSQLRQNEKRIKNIRERMQEIGTNSAEYQDLDKLTNRLQRQFTKQINDQRN